MSVKEIENFSMGGIVWIMSKNDAAITVMNFFISTCVSIIIKSSSGGSYIL